MCLIIDYVIFDMIVKLDNFNINLRVYFHYTIGHNSKGEQFRYKLEGLLGIIHRNSKCEQLGINLGCYFIFSFIMAKWVTIILSVT